MNLNAPIDFKVLFSRRNLLILAAIAVVAAGGYCVWKYLTDPPRPWLVRWKVTRYLKKESGARNFKIDFAFPSKEEMAKAPPKTERNQIIVPTKGERTGKSFDELKSDYIDREKEILALDRAIAESEAALQKAQPELEALLKKIANAEAASGTNLGPMRASLAGLKKKTEQLQGKAAAKPQLRAREAALEPVVSDLWAFQRAWAAQRPADGTGSAGSLAAARVQLARDMRGKLNDAMSYAAMYELIGQQLWVAGRLLESGHPDHRREAMRIALQASRDAINDAINGWLAARIIEGYVWPNLDLADDPDRRSPLNLENLVNECANIFRQNDEMPGMLRTYGFVIAKATTPQRADWARVQIAQSYEQNGDFQEAVHYLKQVRSTNDFAWALRRLPRLEARAKMQR